MCFLEYFFQPAPELCVGDITTLGIVVVLFLGRVDQATSGKWTALAPTVAIVVNARDEITVSCQLSEFTFMHRDSRTFYFGHGRGGDLTTHKFSVATLILDQLTLNRSGHCNVLCSEQSP